MKAFDLEKALAGEKVITRDGREVTQLVNFMVMTDRSLCGVLDKELCTWLIDGVRYVAGQNVPNYKLFMAIELIDGKAYQFGYKGLSRLHGIYCMKTDTLCFHSGHPNVSDCTDIKPLTVEVK